MEPLELRLVCSVANPENAIYEAAWQSAVQAAHEQWLLTGVGQTVAIVDSGIAYDHPALGAGLGTSYRVVGGWDFTEENDADPYDDAPAGFHGTHVAGILASDDRRYPGMAPDVNIVSLRVFDDQGRSDFRWIEKALKWIYDHRFDFASPITTVNLSLGVSSQELAAANQGILDDELRQLVDAGVFVAVAAGNGYDRDAIADLNYPASNPLVVAVGSTTADGQLSAFTRREPRMLLAPGEKVTSTITDYLYDFNGRTDDFHAFSGTSQATPRIAGAAILLREALQRAGHSKIDQGLIFDILRRTADPIVNPSNGHVYARVNLRAALDYVLPDDLPSQASQARDLGVLGQSLHHQGKLETVSDQDFFTVVAGRTGTLRWTLRHSGAAVRGRIFLDGAEIDSDTPVSVRAGQKVLLRVDGQTLAAYDGTITLDAWEDLGAVRDRVWKISESMAAYQFQTSRPGLFTLILEAGDSSDLQVDLRDAKDRNLLKQTVRAGEVFRFDRVVGSQEAYRLQLDGAAATTVHLANLVEFADGGVWRITAPDRLELTEINLDRTLRVSLGRLSYEISPQQARHVELMSQGTARLRVHTNRPDDRLYLRSHQLIATDGQQLVQVSVGSHIEILGVAHQGQELRIYGSDANDRFESRDGRRIFQGIGGTAIASSVDRVYVFGRGGEDTAILHGSRGDDLLVAEPEGVRMSVGQQLDFLEGFERVEASGGSAGIDRALLTGSAGNDRFSSSPDAASFILPSAAWYLAAFDKVYANGGAGGLDRAFLQGSAGNDELLARPEYTCLSGLTYTVTAADFDRVYADGGAGGWDRARLEGSDDDDVLTLRAQEAILGAGESVRVATNFDLVAVDARAGSRDRIVAPWDEKSVRPLMVSGDWIRLAPLAYLWQAKEFDQWRLG